MDDKSNKVSQLLTPKKVAIPIIIGLLVTAWLFYKDFDVATFNNIHWPVRSFTFLFLAIVMMALRDLAYMIRIRVLTEKQLSWKSAFNVIMLWEFASSITPSVVGGSGIAIYFIHKEGISLGKSTSIVMITALLDELFYIIMVPLILLITGIAEVFPANLSATVLGLELNSKGLFLVGYGFIFLLICIIFYAIFISPKMFKKILLKVFKIKWLKKWRYKIIKWGDDLIQTSKEMKGKSLMFWIKSFGATFFSWTARFWVVNFLITMFTADVNQFLIYAKQLVMWVILLISPTPGGSGVAEYSFKLFFEDIIPVGLVLTIALLWRILSYYAYLFIGSVILPRWILLKS